MVVRQGMTLALAGMAAGLAGALALARLVSGMLVRLASYDVATFAAAALFLFLVSLAATWLPAWRATHINPTVALRRA
jgi:putative ABC transport system permease protein